METQQMMDLLLARFNVCMKEHKQDTMERMEADRKADQEKAEANREELKEMMKAMQEEIIW
jgi:Skp family chaperone for outer membrane proteins